MKHNIIFLRDTVSNSDLARQRRCIYSVASYLCAMSQSELKPSHGKIPGQINRMVTELWVNRTLTRWRLKMRRYPRI